jgi:hypothetical protein
MNTDAEAQPARRPPRHGDEGRDRRRLSRAAPSVEFIEAQL